MGKKIAVCLLSGGVDSTVSATLKALEPDTLVILLSIYYGQGAQQAEREQSVRVADWLRKQHPSVIEHCCLEIGGHIRWSSSTSERNIPLAGFVGWRSPNRGWDQAGYPSTRDEAFVLIAAAGLEARLRDIPEAECGEVVLSTTRDDVENFRDIMPTTYTNHINAVLASKMMPHLGKAMIVDLPFIKMSKAEVVRKGAQIAAPLQLTWSCYFGEPGIPCNACDQCNWRRDAFADAGLADPAIDHLLLKHEHADPSVDLAMIQ